MKDKLKTLKEIEFSKEDFFSGNCILKLKEEAIKWVKAYENWPDNNYKREFVKLFKLFFNLTEEDLK